MSSNDEIREWSDEDASAYCSKILGKPVQAVFKPEDGSELLARAEHDGTIVFHRREMPRWVLWHEVGHLAEAPGGIYNVVAPKVHQIYRDVMRTSESSLTPWPPDKMAEIGEKALSEVKAHLWAISKAVSAGESDVAAELVEAIELLPSDKPAYAQAAAILRSVIDDVL